MTGSQSPDSPMRTRPAPLPWLSGAGLDLCGAVYTDSTEQHGSKPSVRFQGSLPALGYELKWGCGDVARVSTCPGCLGSRGSCFATCWPCRCGVL